MAGLTGGPAMAAASVPATSPTSSGSASATSPAAPPATSPPTSPAAHEALFLAWTAEQAEQLAALERAEARTYAERATLLVDMSAGCDSTGGMGDWRSTAPLGSLLLEVAGTAGVHQNTAAMMLGDAQHLVGSLPLTLAAMLEGRLHLRQAQALLRGTRQLSNEVCGQVEQVVLDKAAGAQQLMPSRVAELVKKTVLQLDPASVEVAHEVALADRDVRVGSRSDAPDGMVDINAQVDATAGLLFAAGLDALEDRSRIEQTDATGTALRDQGQRGHRRADLLTDLPGLCAELMDQVEGFAPLDDGQSLVRRWFPELHARALARARADASSPPDARPPGRARPARRGRRGRSGARGSAGGSGGGGCGSGGRGGRGARPQVQIRVDVPVLTCLGRSDEPGYLHGYGPISATQVLELLPTAELRRALVDARTGVLLALDPPGPPPLDLDTALDLALAQTRAFLTADQTDRDTHLHRARLEDTTRDGTERRRSARPSPTGRSTARPGSAPDDGAALLRDWLTAPPAPAPAADANGLDEVQKQLLVMALTDRQVLPDDPSRRVEPQHDPSTAMSELVTSRDRSCDGIGCTVSAHRTDLDHHQRYDVRPASAGGTDTRTSAAGLRPRSRRCHQAKHHPQWSVTTHGDGTSTWTSPTGRRYTTSTRATSLDLDLTHPRALRPAPTKRPAEVAPPSEWSPLAARGPEAETGDPSTEGRRGAEWSPSEGGPEAATRSPGPVARPVEDVPPPF
jgi:uncharacterized membrane protein YgcG